ncbi:maleylpyruvate isomerase N-terminal domain-containing protein [Polymorphospora sp. NPDC051019]|uniref:maleylpyruvate isomerase N-terminal domain-containing protein n=1 Tax=Polymorphospora sp. NPDC051019 TaxID=3155725 RepID=UPI0034479DD1
MPSAATDRDDPRGRPEIDVFLDTLQDVPPHALTACQGWTAHEVVAHLVSGVELLTEQARAHLEGRPAPAVTDWAARELPYQALDDRVLRRRLETGEREMTELFKHLAAPDPTAAVPGLGWGMPVGELVLHMRQEFAVHRWDLVGDDGQGDEVLARPELLAHSVRMLQNSLLATGLAGAGGTGADFAARLRCPDQPDLVVEVRRGEGRFALVEPDDGPAVETDPAARLLLLWGRRPSDPRRVRSGLPPGQLQRLQQLLCGF